MPNLYCYSKNYVVIGRISLDDFGSGEVQVTEKIREDEQLPDLKQGTFRDEDGVINSSTLEIDRVKDQKVDEATNEENAMMKDSCYGGPARMCINCSKEINSEIVVSESIKFDGVEVEQELNHSDNLGETNSSVGRAGYRAVQSPSVYGEPAIVECFGPNEKYGPSENAIAHIQSKDNSVGLGKKKYS